MDMKMRIAQIVADAAAADFSGANLTADQIAPMLEIPPEKKLGDYAFPCFKLAKVLRKGPPMIAQSLAAHIDVGDVARCECVGGYLNFFLNRENFARDTMKAVLAAPGRWGASNVGEGKTVCLDYSSINIAKRFHIGHLSTTMIGNALKRIFAFNGYKTVGINHLGDWGTQFGKMVCAYKKWGCKEDVEKGGVQALVDLYVRFHAEAEKDPALEDEGRAWFKKIEEGDEEALEIFNWFKAVTLKDTERVYKLLDVEFESYAGESFYVDKVPPVIDALREKGLLVESDGAQIVSLDEYNMPPCLLIKSDGTTIYAARDLAAAFYRKQTYDFDKCLYVVAYQQDLHFRQLFKVIELMGCAWAKDLVHVSFGMVSYEGQSLSTRKGNIVYLDELLEREMKQALTIINEKSHELENNRIKDIDFSWERALSFDGETAPYVQYTHARCCSLLRKAGVQDAEPDYAALTDDEAQALLLLLSRFPDVVREAMDKYEPFMVTRHVTRIAQAYNKFYYEHRILDGEPGEVAARVALTRATQDVIRTGLYLIGIQAPERM